MTEQQETQTKTLNCKIKKIPYYKNVICILAIVELAILLMFGIDAGLVLLASNEELKVTYESHSAHIINLQMIAVGGSVAMFERLIPSRNKNGGDQS